jgi:uncharacterized protein
MSRALDAFSRLAALRPARRQENQHRETSPVGDTHRRDISSAGGDNHFPRGISSDIPPGAERLAQILGASPASNRYGEHLALRRWFSEPVVAGDECFTGSLDDPVDSSALRLIAPGAPDEVADPRQWLFLDTETTGLCGGSGTYPFLVGIAWWDAGGLEVEQFFMRDHSEEHSVLLALSERLAERRVLVTFNGKSFDWPLLETRYRMTRAIHPPKIKAHLDFLHPARNLWRLRLGSVRLAELERQVLGWNRGADIISELIPSFYFDFLRGGSPDPLVPIFHHNQMDLRGLAALASRVISVLANPESHGPHALDIFGVSRICERRGEAVLARKLYARSIAAALPPETDRLAKKSLARLAKRDGDFELACELWHSMVGNSREGFEAYEQLAIHYERRAREPHRAAILIRQALAELRKADRLGIISSTAYRKRRERFDRRLARLERRTRRSLLDALQTTTLRAEHGPDANKESA